MLSVRLPGVYTMIQNYGLIQKDLIQPDTLMTREKLSRVLTWYLLGPVSYRPIIGLLNNTSISMHGTEIYIFRYLGNLYSVKMINVADLNLHNYNNNWLFNDHCAMKMRSSFPTSHNLNWFCFISGRRVCMGETLAKMELFLFFSSLMHRFKFELPPGAEKPSTEPVPGFTLSPQPFQVIIKEYC